MPSEGLVQLTSAPQAGAVVRAKRSLFQAPRSPRYLLPFLRHATPRKMANLALVEAEMRLGRSRMRGKPYYYFIDVCNLCNLRCPLCPTGNYSLDRDQGRMSLDVFRELIDRVKQHALVVSVYNLGEPFLNRHVFQMIEYAQRSNIGTNLSSNFNWPVPVDVNDIVRSGLEYITISVDGVTQETYEKYRVNGKLDEALENVRALVAARKRMNSRWPRIEWQFIVFKHNEHEREAAREMARQLGVDHLRFVSPTIPPEFMSSEEERAKWLPEDPVFRQYDPALSGKRGYIQDKSCFYLYRTMTIDPDGSVAPCCFARQKDQVFGNVLEHSLDEVWNNSRYLSGRALFGKQPLRAAQEPVMCDGCDMYRKRH